MSKMSIRFYKDHEVRAVWDEQLNKWWFSAVDVIAAINDEPDYTKSRNYWKYLKNKFTKEQGELVSATNQLKLLSPDGKRRLTDVLDSDSVILLAKNYPNNRANSFIA